MSGGVDSSVAALLMKKAGYDVIGAFMKNWSRSRQGIGKCWKDEIIPAIKVAAQLEIPLITFDFQEPYYKEVVEEMYKSYKKGITPNPDVDCNNKVKFPLFWKEAQKMGLDYIVTGHHARIKKTKKGQFELLRGKDEGKDQSYFLYRLTQDDLKHTLFPIGNYTKKEVRKIAKKAGFGNYNRKSTVGLCFIGKVNIKEFLQKKIKPKQGKILDPKGRQIGTHDGIYYYTIGQRIGPRFGIEIEKGKKGVEMKKWYVARKISKTNTIIAAPENHPLNFRKEMTLNEPHWINEKPKKNAKVFSRIRQVGELLPSKLSYKNGKYHVALSKPITGVSEGQAIVLYQGTRVLGGGVISF